MRRFVLFIPLAVVLLEGALAADAIQDKFMGNWNGSADSCKFKLTVAQEGGNPKCVLHFEYQGEEVVANVTLCKVDAGKIEMQTNFDLDDNQLQPTMHGEKKGNSLVGTYETKALAEGSVVDQGDWKVAPAP